MIRWLLQAIAIAVLFGVRPAPAPPAQPGSLPQPAQPRGVKDFTLRQAPGEGYKAGHAIAEPHPERVAGLRARA